MRKVASFGEGFVSLTNRIWRRRIGEMDTVQIPFKEVSLHSVNMVKLVSLLFNTSKAEAKRLIKSGAVEVVERRVGDKVVEERRVARGEEWLLLEAEETETLIRKGREWRRVKV